MINNKFNYNNLPNNGNYVFYYDPISGKMSYIFKYSSIPIYGCYTFKYSPQDDILVEDSLVYGELLGKLIKVDNNEKIIELAEISSKIDNFKRNLFTQISNVQFELDLGMNSSFSKDVDLDKLIDLRKLRSFKQTIRDGDILSRNNNKKTILLEDDIEKLVSNEIKQFYTEIMSNPTTKSENSISQMACNELVSRYEKLIELDTDLQLKTLARKLFLQELEKLDRENYDLTIFQNLTNLKSLDKKVGLEEFVEFKRRHYDISIEETIKTQNTEKNLATEEGVITQRTEYNLSLENSKRDTRLKKEAKNTKIEMDLSSVTKDFDAIKQQYLSELVKKEMREVGFSKENISVLKEYKDIKKFESNPMIRKKAKDTVYDKDISSLVKDYKNIKNPNFVKMSVKDFKNTNIEKNEEFLTKWYKNIKVEDSDIFATKDSKGLDENKDYILEKFNKNIKVEDSERKIKLISKLGEVELDSLLKLSEKVVTSNELDLINKEKKEIQEEIEEKLKLHKRFWFLKNVGQMDIKILPNRDSVYPPDISLFDESQTFFRYMYSYEDKFKDITKGIKVRLYKNIPTGIELKGSFEINDISSDLSMEQDGIQIVISHLSVTDMDYNYRLSITVNTNRDDFDYLVIEQPQGFLGNEFVFVTSEKFLADNHPIPLGEDLGLREIPISIAIMVDFINILLLIWSKRHYAFSGYMGTQAIQGMVDLVYEWITLETSIEQEAIEEYNRCFRWFRWEAEKVYNKAKLDPNLHGNRWIEEVLFEMIDYMEMHHFNEMPEWDKIEKMDEHRNIFQDVHLDIPIVLDKFKGIRKRIISPKNKR